MKQTEFLGPDCTTSMKQFAENLRELGIPFTVHSDTSITINQEMSAPDRVALCQMCPQAYFIFQPTCKRDGWWVKQA